MQLWSSTESKFMAAKLVLQLRIATGYYVFLLFCGSRDCTMKFRVSLHFCISICPCAAEGKNYTLFPFKCLIPSGNVVACKQYNI